MFYDMATWPKMKILCSYCSIMLQEKYIWDPGRYCIVGKYRTLTSFVNDTFPRSNTNPRGYEATTLSSWLRTKKMGQQTGLYCSSVTPGNRGSIDNQFLSTAVTTGGVITVIFELSIKFSHILYFNPIKLPSRTPSLPPVTTRGRWIFLWRVNTWDITSTWGQI